MSKLSEKFLMGGLLFVCCFFICRVCAIRIHIPRKKPLQQFFRFDFVWQHWGTVLHRRTFECYEHGRAIQDHVSLVNEEIVCDLLRMLHE